MLLLLLLSLLLLLLLLPLPLPLGRLSHVLHQVSRTSSTSLWISAVCGIGTTLILFFCAPNIMAGVCAVFVGPSPVAALSQPRHSCKTAAACLLACPPVCESLPLIKN